MLTLVTIPPEGIKFHANPSNSRWNISPKNTNISLMVRLQRMYKENWIQLWRRGPIHSYESCSLELLTSLKITRILRIIGPMVRTTNFHWLSGKLTWANLNGDKMNCRACVDARNVIGLSGSNPDSEISHLSKVLTPFFFFYNVSL